MARVAMNTHRAPSTAEEEEELVKLAIAMSLAEAGGRPSPPVRQQPVQQPVQRPPPPAPPAPLVYGQPSQPGSWGSGAQAPFHYPPVYSPQPPFYPHKAPSAPPAPAAQQLPQGGSGRQAAPPSMTPAQQQPRPAAQPPASGSGRTTAQGSGRQPAGTTSAAAAAPPKRRLHPDPSKCAGCGNAVWSSRLNALNRQWHPACFVCGFCSGPINEGGNVRFAIGQEDGWPYHMDCYKMAFNPVCSVCDTFVPSLPDGRVEFKEQVFWKARYCPRHQSDGTPQCCSCSRFQPKGTEFPQLSDGRFLCLVCLGTVVVDTRDAQPLYDEVLRFFRNMGLPHPERAPMMLVDAFTLNEYSDKEGKDIRSGGPVFHVRGLTLATVYKHHSIPSIVRAAGSGSGLGVSSVVMPLQPSVTCSVSAVLVMFGLPRLLTGSIIAHELMHAWLRMKHVAGLDTKVEEGLCQLLAYLWLDHQANCLTDPEEQRLASYFAYQVREDTSVVYGDGFREAFEAYQQRGLGAVLNDVLRRGRYT